MDDKEKYDIELYYNNRGLTLGDMAGVIQTMIYCKAYLHLHDAITNVEERNCTKRINEIIKSNLKELAEAQEEDNDDEHD